MLALALALTMTQVEQCANGAVYCQALARIGLGKPRPFISCSSACVRSLMRAILES